MFMTGLGGALSVSIAQNILGTVVLKEIPKYTSSAHVDFEDILNLDGVQFLHSTGGVATDQKEVVLQVFTHALDKTFIISIFAGSVCVLLALSVSPSIGCYPNIWQILIMFDNGDNVGIELSSAKLVDTTMAEQYIIKAMPDRIRMVDVP